MNTLIIGIIGAYITTKAIADSFALESFRQWFMKKTEFLKKPGHSHFIVCRLCVGFWISIIFSYCYNVNFFVIWGGSYFLATLEQ